MNILQKVSKQSRLSLKNHLRMKKLYGSSGGKAGILKNYLM